MKRTASERPPQQSRRDPSQIAFLRTLLSFLLLLQALAGFFPGPLSARSVSCLVKAREGSIRFSSGGNGREHSRVYQFALVLVEFQRSPLGTTIQRRDS